MASRFCHIVIVIFSLTDINSTNLASLAVPVIQMKAALVSLSINAECQRVTSMECASHLPPEVLEITFLVSIYVKCSIGSSGADIYKIEANFGHLKAIITLKKWCKAIRMRG